MCTNNWFVNKVIGIWLGLRLFYAYSSTSQIAQPTARPIIHGLVVQIPADTIFVFNIAQNEFFYIEKMPISSLTRWATFESSIHGLWVELFTIELSYLMSWHKHISNTNVFVYKSIISTHIFVSKVHPIMHMWDEGL